MTTPTLDRSADGTIKLVSIDLGAYHIHVHGRPAGSRVYLCVNDAGNRIDITNGYGRSTLPALLQLLRTLDCWATRRKATVRCFATIEQPGKAPIHTPPADLPCPVGPYEGPLTFEGFWNARPWLTYAGNGYGRLLTEAIEGRFYFRSGHILETDPEKRGFDCTTFPMALFNCPVNMAGKYATALAVALGATACGMEAQKEAAVRAFFADRSKGGTGLFMMWSAHHVVLAKDATFHHFTHQDHNQHGGYARGNAATWGNYKYAPQGLWWLRKLPGSLRP